MCIRDSPSTDGVATPDHHNKSHTLNLEEILKSNPVFLSKLIHA
jgi:hypothetical protein